MKNKIFLIILGVCWIPIVLLGEIHIDLSKDNVGGVRLGDNRKTVVARLGQPNKVDKIGAYIYSNKNMIVGFENNLVASVEIKGPSDVKTSRAVGIGSTKVQIENA